MSSAPVALSRKEIEIEVNSVPFWWHSIEIDGVMRFARIHFADFMRLICSSGRTAELRESCCSYQTSFHGPFFRAK